MKAADAVRVLARCGDRGYLERRRVRREQAVVGDDALELAEEIALGLQILDHGFHDHVAARKAGRRLGDADWRSR